MKKQILITILSAATLLTTKQLSAQQWSWVSGTSGPIKTATNATDVNIANALNVTGNISGLNVFANAGTVKGYNLQATNLVYADGDIVSAAGNIKCVNGEVSGYNLQATNLVYANGDIVSAAGNIKCVNGEVSGYTLLINHDGWIKTGLRVGPTAVTPPGYRMSVEGGIITEKLKVAVSGTSQWSDYVFADNYELKPLEEVESFIGENKHLPDVPSADEVVKSGIDVATMDAKLLQKIEELTLYVIDQQKQIEALKSKLNK